MDDKQQPQDWTALLKEQRTRDHVAYARHYADHFAHGAPGHLDLMTIAELARLLDKATAGEGGRS